MLWAAGSPERLPEAARRVIDDTDNTVLFSAVSVWKIAVKHGFGREDFRVEPHALRRGLLDNGYSELRISCAHAVSVATLSPIHRDPFDRLLIAQALSEGIMLVTADPIVALYPGPIRRV